MNRVLIVVVLAIAAIYLASENIKANTTETVVNTQPGLETKNLADAKLISAQADVALIAANAESNKTLSDAGLVQAQAAQVRMDTQKVADEIRRQREMDDGIAANVGARILTNTGITSAQQLAGGWLQCLSLVPLFVIVLIVLVLIGKRKPSA